MWLELVRNAVDPGCLQQQTEIAIQAFGQLGLAQMINYHVDLGKPL